MLGSAPRSEGIIRADSAPHSPGFPGPDGWLLAPEGAAIHLAERTAVIADVHLGYEWARASRGDCLPAHSLAETLAKLAILFDRWPVNRLIVAGDLVESPLPCRRTAEDLGGLTRWLDARQVSLLLVHGNHDPRPAAGTLQTQEVAGWTIGHGHRPIDAQRSISGHIHPVLRVGAVTAPCFLVGQRTIILPAFSPNAAGWNVMAGFPELPRPVEPLRCIAGAGGELLDFGLISTLPVRLRAPRGGEVSA
ncbi:metallophosphoesterase [Singulisphaera acidiphila]|uniref:Putative phosphoesterase, ICC n=1 Tax=Singulisphaera acidiphila (strain ATCC BAA-1392 / DSM 18658 / VKM B-2454 / MOB10) TaxID=886293 RepID=L0D8F8_SINAD|nr:metallophosphoesterase [Singulisphaera acidiphila]AGA25517.1 putative phosphoesterase, ICC [Singulisphaera acidiphila DSM 18658]